MASLQCQVPKYFREQLIHLIDPEVGEDPENGRIRVLSEAIDIAIAMIDTQKHHLAAYLTTQLSDQV